MAIDVHAHYIPLSVMDQVKEEGSGFGVELAAWGAEGPQLKLGEAAPGRPIIKELLDLEEREKQFKEQNLRHQVLSTWLDTVGYNLPVEQGCRWTRLLNHSMGDDLNQQPRHRHFTGIATVPLQSGEKAAEELQFAIQECGFAGVTIGTHVNGNPVTEIELRAGDVIQMGETGLEFIGGQTQ